MTCAGALRNWPSCIWNNTFGSHPIRRLCVKEKLPRIQRDTGDPERLQRPRRSPAPEPRHTERTGSASGLKLRHSHRLLKGTGGNYRGNSAEFRYLRDDDFVKKGSEVCKEKAIAEKSKNSEILFGIAPCYAALMQSRRTFLKFFLNSTRDRRRPEVEAAYQRAQVCNIPVQLVSRKMLDALCKGRVHQGLCLEASPLHYLTLEDTLDSEIPNEMCLNQRRRLWLVLDGLQDPMNLGAVLRSAYFLGVDKVVISQENSCPLTPVVSKASSGAMEVMEVYSTSSLQEFLKETRDVAFPLRQEACVDICSPSHREERCM
uniref:rRNA methyltransferase 1, mitochondrial n=1 Tax=Geotrypetes seraphini TaxID=260995 RepID=A0A6P8PVC4_GEOSA|nr:rRNA methyltransferase 1, mitochondrial isoform X2 [Geotrypetes seraphini]